MSKLDEIIRTRQCPGISVRRSRASDISLSDLNRTAFAAMENEGLFKRGSILRREMDKIGFKGEMDCKNYWDRRMVSNPEAQNIRAIRETDDAD